MLAEQFADGCQLALVFVIVDAIAGDHIGEESEVLGDRGRPLGGRGGGQDEAPAACMLVAQAGDHPRLVGQFGGIHRCGQRDGFLEGRQAFAVLQGEPEQAARRAHAEAGHRLMQQVHPQQAAVEVHHQRGGGIGLARGGCFWHGEEFGSGWCHG